MKTSGIACKANVQDLLKEASYLIGQEERLSPEKKVTIEALLNHADFLVGKYDAYYERFLQFFASLSVLDFTKQLLTCEGDIEFIQFLSFGLNTVVEELNAKAMHRNLVHTMVDALSIKDTMMLITDCNGKITFVNAGTNGLPGFNEATLLGQGIYVVFKDFEIIDEKIKAEGCFEDIDVAIKWKGTFFPGKLTVNISSKLGKVDGLVYVVRINTVD